MHAEILESAPEFQANESRWRRGLTRNVFVLGAVSLFTDISSEMIAPIRIFFLVFTLHTPLVLAGMMEGVAESMSSLIKVVSGRLADRFERRKPAIVSGYGLSNLAKPLLALAGAWQAALGIVVVDRMGKGLRSSPRDAVLAESTSQEYRGKAFGFHRAMDTLGAAVGPLLTVAILALSNNSLRVVLAWTAVPGTIGVVIALVFLREPRAEGAPRKGPIALDRVQRSASLGAPFWLFTGIATIFALGNSSDAFIFLRTVGLEQSLEAVPLVYFSYNVVYALLATPLGALSDRRGRVPVLIGGYTAFALVYFGWAVANAGWNAWMLFLLYGVYAAATEGVGKALVTDLVPRERKGTALGWYAGLTGLAALPANVIGGWLWSTIGPSATFEFGAIVGFAAAVLLLVYAVLSRGYLHRGASPGKHLSLVK